MWQSPLLAEARPAARRVQSADAVPAISSYDARLRREITHRRSALSLIRRPLRVLTLHGLDGGILVALLLFMAEFWSYASSVRPYTLSIVTIFLISLGSLAAYSPGEGRRDRRRLFGGVALGLLILGVLTVFPPHLPLHSFFLAGLGFSAFILLVVGRMGADLLVRQAYARGFGLRRALLLGDLDETGRAILQLRNGQGVDQYVVGHLAPDDRGDPTALGSLSQLDGVLDSMDIQEVVVAGALAAEPLQMVIRSCFERGVALYVVPALFAGSRCRAEPFRVGAYTLLRLHPAQLQLPALLVKRALDVVAASLILILLAPLVLVIAAAIRIDSPGPVFFRQERIGLGGRRFRMWKFRSMAENAERRMADLASLSQYPDRRLFKVVRDPRVTRVGRLLRRTSLDELPQLCNVLRGEMSLVGPRPPVPQEVAAYEPHHFERLSVVPGMTGPWQVGGRNLITDFEKVVQMEQEYIRSWTLKTDARILLRTFRVVITGEGAY